jgi:hypothetical protein
MDETKRIIIDNYPVNRLPEEIREQFEPGSEVMLTVQAREAREAPRTFSEIFEAMHDHRRLTDDPVARIRALRDSSRRDKLHARIRRGEKT